MAAAAGAAFDNADADVFVFITSKRFVSVCVAIFGSISLPLRRTRRPFIGLSVRSLACSILQRQLIHSSN